MKELSSRLHGQCTGKRGNSDSKERMSLINEFLEHFGDRQIACLAAEREFVGQDWLSYLLTDPLTHARIRIRENHNLRQGGRILRVSVVFQNLKPGQQSVLRNKRQLWGAVGLHRRIAPRRPFLAGGSHSKSTSICDYRLRDRGGELKPYLAFLRPVDFAKNRLISLIAND